MALPPLPRVGDLLRLYKLKTKSELSQNFLLDLNITDKLLRVFPTEELQKSTVIEVGAGPGSLTRSLLNSGAKKVIAVEKDKRFVPILQALEQAAGSRLKVVYGDMLELNEKELLGMYARNIVEQGPNAEAKVKLVGNLPYGVSTEMLLKWLRQIDRQEAAFEMPETQMLLLFQKEVADRILAPRGTSEYTRLSVMTQRLCHVEPGLRLEGKFFVPPPDVVSQAVLFTPRAVPLGVPVAIEDVEFVCNRIFSQKRKMMSSIIRNQKLEWATPEALAESGIEPTIRPQQIPIENWCKLASIYRKWKTPLHYSDL